MWNSQCNCYGYAVQVKDWLLMNDKRNPDPELYYYGLRRVRKQDMVLGREYVAYRYGTDDFHFMRRGKDGHWRHKQGYTPVKVVPQKKVFARKWYRGKPGNFDYGYYDSKIFIYEVVGK